MSVRELLPPRSPQSASPAGLVVEIRARPAAERVPLWSAALSRFVLMACLTLFDGVFLSILATQQLSSARAAAGIGISIFSGAGVIVAGGSLPQSLPVKLLIASLVYLAVGLVASLYDLLLPAVHILFLSDHLLRALAALLLVQLALVVAGLIPGELEPPPVRGSQARYALRLLSHYQLTALLLGGLLAIHIGWLAILALRPFLAGAVFPPSDLAVIAAWLASALLLPRLPILRPYLPPCSVPCEDQEQLMIYLARVLLDLRITLPLLALAYLASVLTQIAPALRHAQVVAPQIHPQHLALVALAVVAAYFFTCLGLALFHLSEYMVHETTLRYAGGLSLCSIAATELQVPLPAGTSIAILGLAIIAGVACWVWRALSGTLPRHKEEGQS